MGWPVPSLDAEIWARLPEEEDGLLKAAGSYYGTRDLLAVAGSQAAIQVLPRLRPPCRVTVLTPGYSEHRAWWKDAGHTVTEAAPAHIAARIRQTDVLVVSQPNNPTGHLFSIPTLRRWRRELAARGGWLVVDEAFADVEPDHSLTALGPKPGLFVLRSLGKFFGLAGLRVGFLMTETGWRDAVAARLGPWTLSTPARWIATAALADSAWQNAAMQSLPKQSARLAALLGAHGLAPDGGTPLFQWVITPEAEQIGDALARQGVLVRQFSDPPSLRFGLPGLNDWNRLGAALEAL